jgi:hypothetical protein
MDMRLTASGVICALTVASACSSSSGGAGAGDSGTQTSTGDASDQTPSGDANDQTPPHDGSTSSPDDAGAGASGLFSDPSVPTCMQGFIADTLITGTIAGQPVSIMGGGGSELDPKDYYDLQSDTSAPVGRQIWHAVDLTWSGTLAENQSVALTGGYILLTPTDPTGMVYCITSGDFGPEPLVSDASMGRVFLFRVTGARVGNIPVDGGATQVDCSGATVDAKIAGCIYRTDTYLP